MEFRTLNNGTQIPCLGIGTFRIRPEDCEISVSAAIEAGYRLIDTANVYLNEKAVGRGIKKAGVPREELILTTKLWPTEFKYQKAKAQIDATLKRLDTDYVDIMLLHQQYGDVLGAWKALEEGVREGKIKTLGVSNFDEMHLIKLLANCTIKPAIIQVECHPYYQQTAIRELLKKENIVLESWYPLGSGNSGLLGEETVRNLAQKYGKTAVQILLRWHVQEGFVVIPGSKNPLHIKENADIFDFELDEDDMKLMRALDKNKRFFNVPKVLQRIMFHLGKIDFDKQS